MSDINLVESIKARLGKRTALHLLLFDLVRDFTYDGVVEALRKNGVACILMQNGIYYYPDMIFTSPKAREQFESERDFSVYRLISF
jgi:hypothetical protein